MMSLQRIVRRVRAMMSRRRLERELRDELEAHIAFEAESLRRKGHTAADARRTAALSFGSLDATREECRDVRGLATVDALAGALRYGARSLRGSPGFALAVVGVLGLGIAAATVAFGVASAVLFRPLPYGEADRLFSIYETDAGSRTRIPSYPTFLEWRDDSRSFSSLAFVRGETLGVRSSEGTTLLLAGYTDEQLFPALAATPALGRTFDATEAASGAPVVVLGWHIWRDQFAADPAVIGREISTESGPFTVIGVMPEAVRIPAWADLWLPIGTIPQAGRLALERRDLHVDGQLIGRLRTDVNADQAVAELSGFVARSAQLHPEGQGWTGATLRSVREEILGTAPGRLLVLGGAAALLLLVSCVNVAGLFVARATARGRELGVRAALGASRARLTGQLLAEALLLSLAGGMIGMLVAATAMRLVASRAPGVLPRLEGLGVDARVLAFALLASTLTAVLFGLAPAMKAAAQASPMDVLRSGRGSSTGHRTERLRSGLVVAQIALAVLLVMGAATLVEGLLRTTRTDLGFAVDGLVTIRVIPPSPRYDSPAAALAFYDRIEAAVAAVPDVQSVAWVNHLPLSGTSMPTTVRTARAPEADENPFALMRTVSASYFDTLGIPIAQGRALTETDVSARAPVVLVNQVLASREWPDGNAIGQSITLVHAAQGRPDYGQEFTATVVGVAADVRHFGPATPEFPAVYVPHTVEPWTSLFLVAGSARDARDLIEPVRRALLEVEPLLPVAGPGEQNRVRPFEAYAGRLFAPQRLGAVLLGTFAGVALLLAAVGLFGVIAYVVLLRQREFGVRLAIGATPVAVVRQVLGHASRLAGIGLAIGLAGAWAGGHALRQVQPQLEGAGAVTVLVAAGIFALVTVLASAAPALRAARVAPGVILRDEG